MRATVVLLMVGASLFGCSRDAIESSDTPEPSTAPSVVASTIADSTTSTSVAPTTTVDVTTTVAPSTAPATEPPTTATPETTAAPVTLAPTTAPASGTCGAVAPIAPGAVESASALIDVDDDGVSDVVRTYATSAAPVAGDWHVRVELGVGGGVDVALPDDPAPGAVKVLGGTYVGSNVEPGPGGMRPVVFIATGAGASASVVTLFRFDACSLVTMTLGGTGEASFTVGAGVTHAENLRCDGVAGTAVLAYEQIELNADGVTFDVTDTGYTRSGNDLVVFGSGPQVTNQPTMPAVATLIDCTDVEHP